MTIATKQMIDMLGGIIEKEKYLLLEGGVAVGKTFLAKQVADQASENGKYRITKEVVSVHSSYSYDDFVYGVMMETSSGHINFEHKDKILLQLLNSANKSFLAKKKEKYFLILDDINRGAITGILGDVLSLIEPHGNSQYEIVINSNKVTIPPNFYIIATRNTVIESIENPGISFKRRFHTVTLPSDYLFMDDSASSHTPSNLDITPNALYNRTKRIVQDHLCNKYQNNDLENNKYVLGHGLFDSNSISKKVRYQVIPLLRQYVKDGVLERTAIGDIDLLERLLISSFSKDVSYRISDSITGYVSAPVDRTVFLAHKDSHFSVVYLLARIKQQGLLGDDDIKDAIMFNPNVILRRENTSGKAFQQSGHLYVKKSDANDYRLPSGRAIYKSTAQNGNANPTVKVDDEVYYVSGEMQKTEYSVWTDDFLRDDYINEKKGSTSPNSVLFLIIKNYYRRLVEKYDAYLEEWPDDHNIELLKLFVSQEWNVFVNGVKAIRNTGSNAKNEQANNDVINLISNFSVLWLNIGDNAVFGGQNLTVEGVFKVEQIERYKEYYKTMDSLGIHQMVMQGPPGTSKTYSTRGLLKYIAAGVDNDNMISNDDLKLYQITNYEDPTKMSKWVETNGGAPVIAWDIVQFHPSYGYEDFVRGIEVSTVKDTQSGLSSISYDTTNKILGKMAEYAARPEYSNTYFFLVVDEINRANLATVFGELIYGLEYRKEEISTPYTIDDSNKIKLPDNLYILGTMNTADKSIGGIDYAIRRRFLFFSLLPDEDAIQNYNLDIAANKDEQTENNEKALALFKQISKLFIDGNLNSEYYKEDVQIGHTYFLVESEEQLYLRFKYQIIPILREYYKDGMFQFEAPDIDDSWSKLLRIVSGELNYRETDTELKAIFDDLCSSEEATEE